MPDTATEKTVKTQAELDAALADETVEVIDIVSERGVWLTLPASDSATVQAFDSATVRAFDSATVRAYGSATVEAFGSATVQAHGSATVRAFGSATVEAFDSATVEAFGSATVEAFDSATVRAFDSATVQAFGSATVQAFDSATVEAYGSATVRAFDSATVQAYGSATVEAFGSATVHGRYHSTITAGTHCAVHLHAATVTVSGGVLIDHTALDLEDPQVWCAYHGVQVTDGTATVYKAVNDNWTTDRTKGVDYSPGATPEATDWRPDNDCGGGLHFAPTPHSARQYHVGATKYLACLVALADLRPIVGAAPKCKAPRVLSPGCVEVDVMARPVPQTTAAPDLTYRG